MIQRDVLIVGFGLAGWALTEALKKHGISFVVYDALKSSSSSIATGIYNPIVLKRFRAIWNVNALMKHSIPFYTQPHYTNAVSPMPIQRVLASVSEQNDWAVASDNIELSPYLNPKVLPNTNMNLHAPFGMGVVEQTGWIDTNKVLTIAQKELEQQHCFVGESFDYSALDITNTELCYKKWKVKHLFFAEGVGIRKNPWFSKLPVVPNKGEWLVVSCKGLGLKDIIKSSVFVVPLGGDRYRVGATYAREFKNVLPTEEGKTWLMTQFRKLTDLPYKIMDHGAGLRPTVTDRKPVIGQHPTHPNLWCVNGLGSRGVLWAPYLATTLVGALKNKKTITHELNLSRFS